MPLRSAWRWLFRPLPLVLLLLFLLPAFFVGAALLFSGGEPSPPPEILLADFPPVSMDDPEWIVGPRRYQISVAVDKDGKATWFEGTSLSNRIKRFLKMETGEGNIRAWVDERAPAMIFARTAGRFSDKPCEIRIVGWRGNMEFYSLSLGYMQAVAKREVDCSIKTDEKETFVVSASARVREETGGTPTYKEETVLSLRENHLDVAILKAFLEFDRQPPDRLFFSYSEKGSVRTGELLGRLSFVLQEIQRRKGRASVEIQPLPSGSQEAKRAGTGEARVSLLLRIYLPAKAP